MHNKKRKFCATGNMILLPCLLLGMSACTDVKYDYNVPESQSDCPSGMNFRSGGSRIVDRDGGSRIKDRNGQEVSSYCEEAECPGDNWSTEPPEIDWHLDEHGYVVANRVCLAT
jgi:hypothetical protein